MSDAKPLSNSLHNSLSSDESTQLIAQWQAAWPQALAAWSKFTRLHDARLCASQVEAAKEGLTGSFAMIRLLDQSVVIDLETTHQLGLDDFAVEILAHEIGHHVLAPATATDQFRLLARIRSALPTLERHAAMVANLYTDLYINDRLQRQANLRMADIYRLLAERDGVSNDKNGTDENHKDQKTNANTVWTLYMGIYEQLWKLDKGSIGGPIADERLETDAWLGARLIRVYANDWLTAAGRFATLLLPYLVKDGEQDAAIRRMLDTKDAAEGCEPSGAQDIEDDEVNGAIHPSHDPAVSGIDAPAETLQRTQNSMGQARQPFDYGEILRASGIKLSDHDIAIRYYRERALPYLIAFPTWPSVDSPEPQLEGLEPWDLGDPFDEVDWLGTVAQSPHVIPGVTTVRRVYGREPGTDMARTPVDLDMYVDSSGSMPNPQTHVSYLALAGAVIALSALRVGARVQITLWSGKREFMHTNGFVRDEEKILRVLTGFYGGGTAFPIHRLRDTYANRPASARPLHILMISDDGITTMFDKDERGNSGWDVAADALDAGRAGGTMALNLPHNWEAHPSEVVTALRRARTTQHWDIHAIARMEDLLEFARAFSKRHYDTRAKPKEHA
jgi:hypothetical protein